MTTQEEKQLLLQDLCARLPYGVRVEHTSGFRGTLHNITVYSTYNDDDTIKDYICYTDFFGDESCKIEFFKPYLFPLSSMTEEQIKEVNKLSGLRVFPNVSLINWYLKNHIDIYGLIHMGLALDATGLNIY